MKNRFTEILSPADRELGNRLIVETLQTPGYQRALRFISAAGLHPRRCWKTCSVNRVVGAMVASTGQVATEEQMLVALATAGFVAREIGGELSTNVALRSLPAAGKRIDMGQPSVTAPTFPAYPWTWQ